MNTSVCSLAGFVQQLIVKKNKIMNKHAITHAYKSTQDSIF